MTAPRAPRWWSVPPAEAARLLGADAERGLSSKEAALRLERDGPNTLPEADPVSARRVFLRQFDSLLIWVLLVSAAAAGLIGEWVDASVIIVIVLVNAAIGFLQEYRAEQAIAALRRLESPTCRVWRDGERLRLPASELARGDLVELSAGDRVPADGRLVRESLLRADESSLTGESTPVVKTAGDLAGGPLPPGDRANMAMLGTVIVHGKGSMLVTETGPATELGRIASLLEQSPPEPTPLQRKLEAFGSRLLYGVFAMMVGVFLLGLARGNRPVEMILVVVSLAIAAIPESLPAVVTIALAFGVRKMARRNALIRHLASVETLGGARVICSDKTGTLTRNEMTVRAVWTAGRALEVTGSGYAPEGAFREGGRELDPGADAGLRRLLRAAALCNDAELRRRDGKWRIDGDPTEGALLSAAGKAGLWKADLERAAPRRAEVPFDSERKRMSTLHAGGELLVKGAPEAVLERCDLPAEDRARALSAAAEHAARAMRVLAVASRRFDGDAPGAADETGLTFLGMVAMQDPPRDEAAAAVAECRAAGVRPVMITGDHLATAEAVGRELGLCAPGDPSLDGAALDAMSDADLDARVESVPVYARVSAEHKLRVVRAWKRRGAVVAMTGDGVNDAPAVHEADIGVAMGLSGTDVTREASDMVILDDNFASIVAAVREGRGIYDNIVKVVFYLLSLNIAELLVVFVAMLAGWTAPGGEAFLPLSALQILWLNLVTDGLPALALAADPADPDAMRRPPRDQRRPILSARFIAQMTLRGAFVAGFALLACRIGLHESAQAAQTLTLTTLVASELVWVQLIRVAYGAPFFSNAWIPAAILGSLTVHAGLLYFPPGARLFGLTAPSALHLEVLATLLVVQTLIAVPLNRWLRRDA